jgi:hypothetical protein
VRDVEPNGSPQRVQFWEGLHSAARQQPNIVFVMGDDIGWFNISAYHHGSSPTEICRRFFLEQNHNCDTPVQRNDRSVDNSRRQQRASTKRWRANRTAI